MRNRIEIILDFLAKKLNKRSAKIIFVLIMLALDYSNSDIRKTLGTSWDSLRKYRSALESGDINSLFQMDNSNRKKSEIEVYNEQISAEFERNPPKTLRQARDKIKEITGLSRSLTQIRKYLLKRGSKIEQ